MASTTPRSPTTSCCAPTIRRSTRPRWSTRLPGRHERATSRRRWRAAPVTWTSPTRRPPTTTTRWSRTPPSRCWDGDGLSLYESTQAVGARRPDAGDAFGLEPEQVRVISPHVGGGFGSKGTPRPQAIVAAMAARVAGRPVKLAVTRQQMFALTGYRTPTIQRVRLGAERDGRLTAIAHEADEQTSTAEGVRRADRGRHPHDVRGAEPPHHATASSPLDVPDAVLDARARRVPGHVRAGVRDGRAGDRAGPRPDRAAGPQRARRRARERPAVQPAATWWSACARAPSASAGRAATRARARREGRWFVGTGVAASTYPAYRRPSQASARARRRTGVAVRIGAADIGTGARTALTQIAADALGVAAGACARGARRQRTSRRAPVAGGSMGTASWGSAVVQACRALRARLSEHGGESPAEGLEATADTTEESRPGALRARTPSAPSSWRRGWTPTPARSACRGCSASSRPDASSTPRPRAPSSSAG